MYRNTLSQAPDDPGTPFSRLHPPKGAQNTEVKRSSMNDLPGQPATEPLAVIARSPASAVIRIVVGVNGSAGGNGLLVLGATRADVAHALTPGFMA